MQTLTAVVTTLVLIAFAVAWSRAAGRLSAVQQQVEGERRLVALGRASSVIAHELRNPLNAILGWASILRDGKCSEADVAEGMEVIERNCHVQAQLIDDLLAYARAGTAFTDAVQVDLHDLLAGIIELLPRPSGIVISTQISARPFVTHKAPLESVLRNLISNAIKHHDLPTGRISIGVADVGRYCVFTVSDDGPGIPLASQERVFRIFQTLATETREHSGIGLALNKESRIAATAIGALMTALTLFLYVPIWILAHGGTTPEIMEAINYVFDTLLYAGAALALASALPRTSTL